MNDRLLYSEACVRNREPILTVLSRVLPAKGTVLEIAAGTGQHAVYFASRLPGLRWCPSDADSAARASIAAWAAGEGVDLAPPMDLDVSSARWPITAADAIVAINLIHIAPWTVCEALMAGAGRILSSGGVLFLYGPYRLDGRHTAPSNAAFDRDLRQRDPAWGVRDLQAVVDVAARHGLAFEERVPMPANNQSIVFRKADSPGSPLAP